MSGPAPAAVPCVTDNMVLAMFIDADRGALLTALAPGSLFVPPSIVDPAERPPFARQPTAEFARGAFYFQQRLGRPLDAVRLNRRTAFYSGIDVHWRPVLLSPAELQLAASFVDPATWRRAETANPAVQIKKVDRGEAECAAVAVTRGWTLWSDDAAIVDLLAALHPGCHIERISDLLARAAREGLITRQEAADLYNNVFKGMLGLWTKRSLACQQGHVVVQ
jgi:hypothetical protein